MPTIARLSKLFQGRRIFIPLGLGLAAGVLMVLFNFNMEEVRAFHWSGKVALWLGVASSMLLFRDLGYVIRLRVLSDNELTWGQCIQLTFLWEFASAISPGLVGGTAAAFILLAQEKINTGKSAAIVLITSFLDVLFFVVFIPLLWLFIDLKGLVPDVNLANGTEVSKEFIWGYIYIAYAVLFMWALLVFVAIFIKPSIAQRTMRLIFKIRFLRKWRQEAEQWEKDLMQASIEFGRRSWQFWFKAFGSTTFSWVARFATVNFIVLAFGTASIHVDVFAQQLILWCILVLPVTPGASGLAETLFPSFLVPFFPSITMAKLGSVIWRTITYYPFVLIGFVIFPIWLKRIIEVNKSLREPDNEG